MSFEEWRQENLEDLCSLIADCPHSTPKWTDNGVFVIRSWNVRDGVMNFDKVSFTDEETYQERIRRAKPTTGDIVITREAPMGEVAMIPDGLKCCLGQRLVLLRPDAKKIDNYYLLYSLQSKYVLSQILSNEGTGSTVSNLRIPDLKALKIPVPKLEQQQKIASILTSLDEKIELNRQTNQTLEAIAAAIFKEWFVDFNFPGASGEMVESELGEIPKGWGVGTISDLFAISKEAVNPSLFPETDFVHYSLPAFDEGKKPARENGSRILSNKFKVGNNSILVSKLNPRIPRIWPITESHGLCICSTEFLVLLPKEKYNFSFGINLFSLNQTIETMKGRATGTSSSHQRIRPQDLLDIQVVLPHPEVMQAFESAVKNFYHTIRLNDEQNSVLTQLRDSILPKLMNGEINLLQN